MDPFYVGAVTDLRWDDVDMKVIHCMVTFPNHPMGIKGPMPFGATAGDPAEHGGAIYARCLAGEFGPIAGYSKPVMTASAARAKRDGLFAATQWLIDRNRDEIDADVPRTLKPEQVTALQVYRQALRSVPDQPNFPTKIKWPVTPAFV